MNNIHKNCGGKEGKKVLHLVAVHVFELLGLLQHQQVGDADLYTRTDARVSLQQHHLISW